MSMNRRSFFGKMAAAVVATPAVVEAAGVAPAPVSGPGLPTATFRGVNQDAPLLTFNMKRRMQDDIWSGKFGSTFRLADVIADVDFSSHDDDDFA